MRVAICISGNFREYKKTLHSITNLTSQFDVCDIFMTYDSSENTDDVTNVINMLKPVQTKQLNSPHICNNLNMWYKIKESYLLFENYSKQKNINYDLIFRTRYDMTYCTNYDLTKIKYEYNTLYVPYTCEYNVTCRVGYTIFDLLRDDIFFGKPSTMKLFMNFYDVIKKSKNKCLEYNPPEHDFVTYLHAVNHKCKKVPFKCSILKFNSLPDVIYTKFKTHPKWISHFLFNKYIMTVIILLILFVCIYLCKN